MSFLQNSFRTPASSLLKTFVMVIGEFEFDTGFNDPSTNRPPAFAYVLFVLFIIVMTILLMNLLVSTFLNCYVSNK